MQSKNIVPLPSAILAKRDGDFHPRKVQTVLSSLSGLLSLANLAFYARRTRVAFRSFRGHIGMLFAIRGGVRLGPAMQRQAECFQQNERTLARAEGIRNLQATHPWVDNVDLQLFLMGFDAGEEHYISLMEKNHSNPNQQQNQTL